MVGEMAKSAGIKDHQLAGSSMIGGSRVIQHWDVPETKNLAKAALLAGKVDVLTLSPIWLPDEGIEKVHRHLGARTGTTAGAIGLLSFCGDLSSKPRGFASAARFGERSKPRRQGQAEPLAPATGLGRSDASSDDRAGGSLGGCKIC